HLQHCVECRAALQRERQYLERLRTAPVPAVSNDLTARLLQQTSKLATETRYLPQDAGAALAGPAPAMVIIGSSAGAAVIAAAVLAVAAYVVAGEPPPLSGAGAEGQ